MLVTDDSPVPILNAGVAKKMRPGHSFGHTWITVLLCFMFALMYLDRVNISAAASSIKTEFGLSNMQMGWVFSAFSWSYLATVLFGGWAARKYGARATLLICAGILGFATMGTALVSGITTLFIARLLVGLGEGPAFPAATQAMRNWYPSERFGLIQGITHSAARLGGAIAPPLVAWIVVMYDWRSSFIFCGAIVLVWAAVWWFYFRDDPRTHRHTTSESLQGISVSAPNRKAKTPWLALTKRMSPVTLVMFTYGWAYWVFVSWLPLYFYNYHHVDLKSSAILSSVPFIAGLIGNTSGGVISDWVLKRTKRNRLARCGVVAVSLVGCAAFMIPVMFMDNISVVVPLLAASMFFLEMTIAPMYAVPMDMSKEYAGLGSAYIIMGVAIAGIVSPVVFGWLVDFTGNWNVPFLTSIGILSCGAIVVCTLHPEKPFVVSDKYIQA